MLLLILGATVIGCLAYFLLCRRVYKKSKSEVFNNNVPTLVDTPIRPIVRPGDLEAPQSTEYLQALMHDDEAAKDVFDRYCDRVGCSLTNIESCQMERVWTSSLIAEAFKLPETVGEPQLHASRV